MRFYYIWMIFILGLLLFSCRNKPAEHSNEAEITMQKDLFFNINVDSLSIETYQIRKNQNLADILAMQKLDYNQVLQVENYPKYVFDSRRMKAGNTYHILKTDDSLRTCKYLIYEKNKVDYVVMHFDSVVKVFTGKKDVKIVLDTISGVIKSSLWASLDEKNIDPQVAVELSEIYGWSIDFFGIQKGDHFKVFLEHMVVEGDTIGIGNIYAANFNHNSINYEAYYYVQKDEGTFFDEKGNSLKKSFLKAPLQYSRISSGFSNKRFHPVLKIYRAHHGVDYAAPTGTPVFTIGDGVVIDKGYQKSGGGNYVKIKHNGSYTTVYMHLNGFAKGLQVGKRLKQGEILGFVGATGLATGPHLDFRVYHNGVPINPLSIKSPPMEPIDSSNRKDFQQLVDSLRPAIL